MKLIKRHPKKLRKIYIENRAEVANTLFKEFCKNSTVHGVRYFAEGGRHWTERIWWLIAFGLSLSLCGSSITNIWMEWRGHPVAFIENSVKISQIPFPTVTICPEYRMNAEEANVNTILQLVDVFRNISNEKLIQLESISQSCRLMFPTNFRVKNEFIDDLIYEAIRNNSFLPKHVVNYVLWETNYDARYAEFTTRFTDEGLCFAFNDLNSHEFYTNEMAGSMITMNENRNVTNWTMEHGYAHNATHKSYPLRVFNARPTSALLMQLSIKEKDYENICPRRAPGFRFFLHIPGEVPLMFRKFIHVPMEEEVRMLIKPILTTTADSLRSFDPNERQCFFQSERRLRFFKLYTQNNCEAECLANFTKRECGCVYFAMPRDSSTKICGMTLIWCYREAEQKIFGEDVIDGLMDESAKSFRSDCNCLPSCSSIKYDVQIDRVNKASPYHDYKTSMVRLFFADHQVTSLKRSETFTFYNFISSCGGLLGLFLGVSVLSIVELIYYATLRLFWSIRKVKSQNTVAPFPHRTIKSISIGLSEP